MPITTLIRTVQADGPLTAPATVPINFEFTANGDMQVVESNTDGSSPVTLAIVTNYTLVGAGNDAGGTLTLVTNIASGKKWTISRVTIINQNTKYVENDEFPAISHEAALDKLTLIAQEFTEELGRTMRVPISGDPTVSTELPPFEVDKVFTVDSTGKKIVMSTFDAGAAAAAAVSAAAALVSELAAAVSAAAALASETAAAASAATIIPDWTNKSGGELILGDVIITDNLVDDAVKTSTTLSDEKVGGVTQATIADDAAGEFLQTGETVVNIKGTVARGDFIRHSTTAKQAESAGTTHAPGVFGRAMAGGTDVLVKCLIFDVSKTVAATGDFAIVEVTINLTRPAFRSLDVAR